MATSATRTTLIALAGDRISTETIVVAHTLSPAQAMVVNLVNGANTITVPTGIAPTAVVIIPPAANAVAMTLKGVSGDTGIALSLTDHSIIALASTVTTFVITTGGAITGVRLEYL